MTKPFRDPMKGCVVVPPGGSQHQETLDGAGSPIGFHLNLDDSQCCVHRDHFPQLLDGGVGVGLGFLRFDRDLQNPYCLLSQSSLIDGYTRDPLYNIQTLRHLSKDAVLPVERRLWRYAHKKTGCRPSLACPAGCIAETVPRSCFRSLISLGTVVEAAAAPLGSGRRPIF